MIKTLDAVRGLNLNLGKAGLAEGTNAATIKTVAAIDYAINGILYTKAITDNVAMTACAQQADLTTCLYLISINAAGTVTITKGVEVLSADLASGKSVLNYPAVPTDNTVIGGLKIALIATTFTSGTTDLSAAGVTATFYDLACIPATPVTS